MKKQISINWKVFSAVGAVLLLVAAFTSFAGGAVGAQDTSSTPHVITVSGTGDAYGAPDVAYVNLGVDVSDADLSKALDSGNKTMAAIVAALTDVGVDPKDIQTASYNVYPQQQTDPQTGQPTGKTTYEVQSSVNVTVRDMSKAGAVMQAGLNAGANTVNGLSFGIADMSALEAQARKIAAADAKDRAQQLADAFGVKLGDVISVSETLGNTPIPVYRTEAMSAAAPVAAPQINGGQLNVNVQVEVTFAIAG